MIVLGVGVTCSDAESLCAIVAIMLSQVFLSCVFLCHHMALVASHVVEHVIFGSFPGGVDSNARVSSKWLNILVARLGLGHVWTFSCLFEVCEK